MMSGSASGDRRTHVQEVHRLPVDLRGELSEAVQPPLVHPPVVACRPSTRPAPARRPARCRSPSPPRAPRPATASGPAVPAGRPAQPAGCRSGTPRSCPCSKTVPPPPGQPRRWRRQSRAAEREPLVASGTGAGLAPASGVSPLAHATEQEKDHGFSAEPIPQLQRQRPAGAGVLPQRVRRRPDAQHVRRLRRARALPTPTGSCTASSRPPPATRSWPPTSPARCTYQPPAGISVSLSGDDGGALHGYWEKLSSSGTVTMPLAKQAWGDEFGMCADQFGVPWLVNISQPQA